MTGQVARLRRVPSGGEGRTGGERRAPGATPDTRQIIETVIERLARSAFEDRGDWRDTSPWRPETTGGIGWDQEGSTITDLDLDEHLHELLESVEPEETQPRSHPHLTQDLVLVQVGFDPKEARIAAEPHIPPPLPRKKARDAKAARASTPSSPSPSPSHLLTPGSLLEGRSIREMVSSGRIERPVASTAKPARSRSLTWGEAKLFLAVLLLSVSATLCTSTLLEEEARLRLAFAELLGVLFGT